MAAPKLIAVNNLKQAGKTLRCEHVRQDGTQCGSPALKDCHYCYAHARMVMRHPKTFPMPLLEDANSVQSAIMETIRGLLDGSLDRKTAGMILYALQLASANLKYVRFEPADWKSVVRDGSDLARYCESEGEEDNAAGPSSGEGGGKGEEHASPDSRNEVGDSEPSVANADAGGVAARAAGQQLQDLAELHRLARSVVAADAVTVDHEMLQKKTAGAGGERAGEGTG